MTNRIAGKVALVTGANRGIGKDIVRAFLSHGAKKVYLGVRRIASTEDLQALYGSRVVPIVMDVTKPETIIQAATVATDVNIVVSNAGILNMCDPLGDDVEERFKEELEVNVFGLLRVAKAFVPVLENNGGGDFVQMNSIASLVCGPSISTYSASKSASYSFTGGLKERLAEKNIHVLSVHPGPIDTDMAAQTGMVDNADPVHVVSESIVSALNNHESLCFPDAMAKEFYERYKTFAEKYFLPA